MTVARDAAMTRYAAIQGRCDLEAEVYERYGLLDIAEAWRAWSALLHRAWLSEWADCDPLAPAFDVGDLPE